MIVVTGDLIPRHMKVFKNNEFFAGLSIPEPDVRESLEAKMPREFSADAMDFLRVSRQLLCFQLSRLITRLVGFAVVYTADVACSLISFRANNYRNASTRTRRSGTRATSSCATRTSPTSISGCPTRSSRSTSASDGSGPARE